MARSSGSNAKPSCCRSRQRKLKKNPREHKKTGAGRSEGGSRTGPLSGRGTCRCSGYEGSADSASAGKGEGDGGGLYRRRDGVARTQPGRRHRIELRRNPVSVLTALQREGISRIRSSEPNLA